MNDTRISDDPKLTAYALGELEGEERAAVEARLANDAEARGAVEEIRAMAAQLHTALAAEAAEDDAAATGVAKEHTDVRAREENVYEKKRAKVLRFPQLYFAIAGLAAACFAVVVWVRETQTEQREVLLEGSVKLAKESADAARANAQAQARQSERTDAQVLELAKPTDPLPLADSGVIAQQSAFVKQRANEVSGSFIGEPKEESDFEAAAKKLLPPVAPVPAPAVVAVPPSSLELTGGTGVLERKAAMRVVAAWENAAPKRRGEVAQQQVKMALEAQARKRAPLFFGSGMPGASQENVGFNTEAYAYQKESGFIAAAQEPLSTFSIDVDTASYANVRRFLENGQRPPVDAVRIEELVNYFPYHYAATAPKSDVPFAAKLDVANAPWAPEHRLVRVGLKAREVAGSERGAANLVFLLDVSGSMSSPNKLPLVKHAMRLLVGKLQPNDTVAIVTYAGASGLALATTPVKRAADILAALDALQPSGSTNGAQGIQLAYDVARAHFVKGGVNRVILCTDGDFNVGVTSEGELTRLITEQAKSGVFLTVLGFGMGNYKDATLEKLADSGNGNYGYVDNRREAEKLLVEQVNGTLVTVAKDVKLQVEFNPSKVARYRLIGYENRRLENRDFNNDKVDAGEIGAGHTVTALYEIIPVGAKDAEDGAVAEGAIDPLKYSAPKAPNPQTQTASSEELLTLKVRYKEPAGDESKKLEFPLVDRGAAFAEADADFKFAASVAAFGMILRDSSHKGTATLGDVLAWAQAGTAEDAGGYRGEFVQLVRRAETLVN